MTAAAEYTGKPCISDWCDNHVPWNQGSDYCDTCIMAELPEPGPMTCPKCKRTVRPWPLARGAKCSPKNWVYCIRNDGEYGRS